MEKVGRQVGAELHGAKRGRRGRNDGGKGEVVKSKQGMKKRERMGWCNTVRAERFDLRQGSEMLMKHL